MRRLTQLSLLTVSLFSSIQAAELTQAHWQNPSYIEQSFIDITFGREYNHQASELNKWAKPINVVINDSTVDKSLHHQLIHHHLRHLSKLSGQTFTYKQNSQPEMHIHVISETDYLQKLHQDGTSDLLKTSVCLAQVQTSASGQISKATIWIPVERARAHGKLLACIVEETTQALGLMNDSEKVFPSIFNDKKYHDFLTGLDLILIKLLYLEALKTGLSKNQTRKIIREALKTPKFESLIQTAEQAVKTGSLENLLNP